jgi:hypothetical protein
MEQEIFAYSIVVKVNKGHHQETRKGKGVFSKNMNEGERFFKQYTSERSVLDFAADLDPNLLIENIFRMDIKGNVDEMQIAFKGRLVLELLPRRHDINFDHMDTEDY